MGRKILYTIGAWFAVVAVSWGQQTGYPVVPGGVPVVDPGLLAAPAEGFCSDCGTDCLLDGCDLCGPPLARFYARGDYLMWWLRGMYVPPLITSSPADVRESRAGLLDRRRTNLVFGNTTIDEGVRSGGRITLGYLLCPEYEFGLEGYFFGIANSSTSFLIASDGIPDDDESFLARPFFNVRDEEQDRILVAIPDRQAGTLGVTSHSQLYGGGVLGTKPIFRSGACRVDLIGGYRYLNLRERLEVQDFRVEVEDDDGELELEQITEVNDLFRTSTQFHGQDLGLRLNLQRGRFFAEVTGKVAFGFNFKRADLRGNTVIQEPDEEEITRQAGLLVLRTNRGGHRDSEFAFVPELALNVGYNIGNHWRALVGYSALYWTDVVRPGEQVNLQINPTIIPPSTTLVGPAQPGFEFTEVDFWLHGLNFSLEFRY